MKQRCVLDLSQYKLNSCIEDRILTCSQCILEKEMNDKPEIYRFLGQCHLEFSTDFLRDDRVDSWYKQPVRIITHKGNDLSTIRVGTICSMRRNMGSGSVRVCGANI